MSARLRVYVSGPLSSSGVREENVARAIDVGRALVEAGYAPLIPHLTHYVDPEDTLGHATWLAVDLPWVAVADAVWRIPGESRGADQECALARRLEIPMVTTLEGLAALPRGDARFHALVGRIGRLHDRKQADYGKATDPFANVRASEEWGIPPWVGALIRGTDKLRRLQTFARKGVLANESALDSMLDLAVYALIAAVLYEEQSPRGTDPAPLSS